jgi:MYXO-CTERM domain-containing protein
MLYAFSKLFEVAADPGNLLVLLLAVGALLAWRRRRGGRLLVGLATIAMVAAAVFPIGQWALVPLENRFPKTELPAKVDGIVLLGGAVRLAVTRAHGETALNGMATRITETMALSRRYPGVPVLISGGDPRVFASGGISEAEATRRLLVSMGLDPRRIVLDDRSRNTYENAVDSKTVAKPAPGQTWVLVTSANHMPRAVGCFRAVGWQVVPDPVDYETSGAIVSINFANNLDALMLAEHEWLGLVAYRLLGRIDSFFPGPLANSSASAQ